MQKSMDFSETLEKNRGRIEHRKDYVTNDIDCLIDNEFILEILNQDSLS